MNFVRIDIGERKNIRHEENHVVVPFENKRKAFVEEVSGRSAVAVKCFGVTFEDMLSLRDDLLYSEGGQTIYIGPVNLLKPSYEASCIEHLYWWANDYDYEGKKDA
jgi:hypothetical protein